MGREKIKFEDETIFSVNGMTFKGPKTMWDKRDVRAIVSALGREEAVRQIASNVFGLAYVKQQLQNMGI